MKLEFKNGYMELNKDNTITIVGEDAHTFYFTFHAELRKNNVNYEDAKEMLIQTIKELAV